MHHSPSSKASACNPDMRQCDSDMVLHLDSKSVKDGNRLETGMASEKGLGSVTSAIRQKRTNHHEITDRPTILTE